MHTRLQHESFCFRRRVADPILKAHRGLEWRFRVAGKPITERWENGERDEILARIRNLGTVVGVPPERVLWMCK